MAGSIDDATNFNSQLGSGWAMHYALQQKQEQYLYLGDIPERNISRSLSVVRETTIT